MRGILEKVSRPMQAGRGYALLTALLFGALCVQALAADFQAGMEAYNRGDYAAALREFRPLAEQGDAKAQALLGVMYGFGAGVPQDAVQAYAWLNVAVGQGFQPAKEARESMAESMTREEISRAQRLAREYWKAYVLPFRN